MDVTIIGMAVHPPAVRIGEKRLEELVFDTAHAALADAGVRRAQIDHVTIAGSDELDGRSISSMLLAAPAGAQLRDEMKCTDSGLTGLCLEAMRIESGIMDLGLLVSWCKPSTAPVEDVMRMRCEPFYTRPIGLNMSITDGLFAQAVGEAHGFDEFDADEQVLEMYRRAQMNPRGLKHPVPHVEDIAVSHYVAAPLRLAHQAPISDGAVAMVVASDRWLEVNPRARPLARVAGIGWRNAGYDLGAERLGGLTSFRTAIDDAVRMAGLKDTSELDLIELDSQTGFHELAFRAALNGHAPAAISPSGGAFAQNPYFCTGLINAAEAILQVSGQAGPVQVPGAKRALAHGAHGFAQQGNVAVVLESVSGLEGV
jgi:acetyl-CoA acetyltransferase